MKPRTALCLLLMLLAPGCLEDNRRQLAQCVREANRANLGKAIAPMSHYDRGIGHDVEHCMLAAGYVLDMRPAKCRAGDPRITVDPYCYRPKGTISLWLSRAELAFDRVINP